MRMTDPAPDFWSRWWDDWLRSLYDIRHFRLLATRPPSTCLLYFLLLATLAAGVDTGIFAVRFLARFDRLVGRLVAEVGRVEVKDGVLTSPVAQPYRLAMEDFGSLVIDTTGAVTRPEPGQVLVTAREVLYGRAGGEAMREPLDRVKNLVLDAAASAEWARTVKVTLIPLVGGMALWSHLLRKAVHVLWLAVLAWLWSRARRRPLAFAPAGAVAVMSLNAPLLLASLAAVLDVESPPVFWFGVFLSVVYLVAGVEAACAPGPVPVAGAGEPE